MAPAEAGFLRVPRPIQVLLIIVILANVSITALDGMRFGFTHDDLMNDHRAMLATYPSLLLNSLEIWRISSDYRPASILVLKIIYSICGMNLTGWRILYGALLFSMALVTLAAVKQLSGSFVAGSIAAVLISYHPSLRMLYFSIGFIFDLLAYLLTGAFLIAYLRARTNDRRSTFLYSGAAMIFFWLALEAKEIAIAGTVFVIVFELLSEPLTLSRPVEWIGKRPLLGIIVLISLVFSLTQLLAPGSLTGMGAYQPNFSIANYFSHVSEWGRLIAETPIPLAAICVAIVSGVLAFVRSWRVSVWCWISFFLGILPVAFIKQRDVTAITVPLLALLTFAGLSVEALCAATAAVLARWPILPARTARHVAIGMCLAATAFIIAWQGDLEHRLLYWAVRDADLAIMPALAALHTVPPPQPGENLIIDKDPFEEMQWADCFLFRLYYRLPKLEVKRPYQVTAQDLAAGRWRHLTWEDNRWKESGREPGRVQP